MKYLFIALVALGLFATLAVADGWNNEWMRDAKISSEGTLYLNISRPAAATKITLTECPDVIKVTRSTYNATVDTIVFPKGCVGSDALWMSNCWEIEDSAFASAADAFQLTTTTYDTLFCEWGTSGAGCDFAVIRRIW